MGGCALLLYHSETIATAETRILAHTVDLVAQFASARQTADIHPERTPNTISPEDSLVKLQMLTEI